MADTEPRGCLATILSLFGIKGPSKASGELPYRLRDDFLSPAEASFFQILVRAVRDQAVVCPKVNLADVFFVVRPSENFGHRNKIDRKHVDFLLCDPAMMRPRCGIELDDASHARHDRRERDALVEQVFAAAQLPLVRVPVKAGYSPADLLALVEPHLANSEVKRPSALSSATAKPTCPKCGVPMVERVAARGQNAGRTFYGCPNYPKCRETVSLS